MNYIKIILFISVPFLFAFKDQKPIFSKAYIYGKWNFIRYYQIKMLEIKDKEKETKIWPDMDVYKTYNSDGDFVYREDDMIAEGKFVFDSAHNTIKEFSRHHRTDTEYLQVVFLDNDFLIYTTGNNTFLYKKS